MENKISVDNRILLSLFELCGDEARGLDKAFIFCKKGKAPVFFSSNGYSAIKIEEAEPELYGGDDKIIAIPDLFKKILKYKKKEEDKNPALNNTLISANDTKVILENFSYLPLTCEFANVNSTFKELPDVFKYKYEKTEVIALNMGLTAKVASALSKLGVSKVPTLALSADGSALCGNIQNENFIVEIALMPCRVETEGAKDE